MRQSLCVALLRPRVDQGRDTLVGKGLAVRRVPPRDKRRDAHHQRLREEEEEGGRGWRGVTCRCGVCRAQLRQDKTTRNKKKEKREGPRKCADSERIVSHHPFTTCYTPRSLLLHGARYCTSTIGTASSSSSTPRPIIALSR